TTSEKRSPYRLISQREDPAIAPEVRIVSRCAYIGHFGSFHLIGEGGTAAYQLGNRKYICDLSLSSKRPPQPVLTVAVNWRFFSHLWRITTNVSFSRPGSARGLATPPAGL